MKATRPALIKLVHLARRAVVYLRQSTPGQVETNTGSTEYQREQQKHPLEWGWAPDQIEVVDDDLGRSGSAAAHRPGYLRLLNEVERREVGIVCMSDLTRGGRNAAEWYRFLEVLRNFDVLLAIDGRISDLQDQGQMLAAQMLVTLGEHNGHSRVAHLTKGRHQRARSGFTVTQPPCGYVRQPDGHWVKDPDRDVQAAIAAVFREFRRQRSCARTVQALRGKGIRLPRRRGWSVRWVEASLAGLYRILTNPGYCGDYVFRRRVADPTRGRDKQGYYRSRKASPGETIRVVGNHEGYITLAELEEVQQILRLNGPGDARRNLGPGSGLLQSLVRCRLHRNHAMATVYKPVRADGIRVHGYACQGTYQEGGGQCGRVQGPPIDRAVISLVFERLNVPQLEVIRDEIRRAQTSGNLDAQHRRARLRRAREHVEELERRYLAADLSRPTILRMLEENIEVAKRELQLLESVENSPSPLLGLGPEAMDDVIALCRDLPAVFYAPSTSNLDRKQILRVMIAAVQLEERDLERICGRVIWADQAPDASFEVKRNAYTKRLIKELADQAYSPIQIADRLNQLNIRTLRGRLWDWKTVDHWLKRLERSGGQPRPIAGHPRKQ